MQRGHLDDILVFVAVAREGSFTKAAARLNLSQSALSHRVRGLEERVGVRLLTRTTRSVSPTDAGERLLRNVAPRLDEIETELDALSDFREKPSGTVRITAGDHAVQTVLWPKLKKLLPNYPDIKVEISTDAGLADIVADRYDAGVRWGGSIAKDMIAVRIGPDVRFIVVGAKSYFAARDLPQTPQDLVDHNCVNLRMSTTGGVYAWELAQGDREHNVRVEGQLVFNNIFQVLDAAVAGLGLAFVPEDLARPYLANGRLEQALDDWCPPWTGYHLYYPHRREASSAFGVLVEALRYRG